MNWLSGWLREQFDFPVNLVRGLVPVEAQTLSFEHGSGAKVEFSGSGGKRYRGVAKFYMADNELFRDFAKGTVEYHNENWSYMIGRTKVFFIDVLSGSPVMLDGGTAVTFSPAVLKELFGVAHLRGAAKAVLAGLGGDWLKYAIGIAIGALGAYTVLTAALGYSAPQPVISKLVSLLA